MVALTTCIPAGQVLKSVKGAKKTLASSRPGRRLYKKRCDGRGMSNSSVLCCLNVDSSAVLSKEQLEFLDRKRKGILPAASSCKSCAGEGMIPCVSCKGTGRNPEGLADSMFTDERGIRQNNNVIDARWLFADNGPCWLCKGTLEIACKECSGVGIPGILEKFSGD